jgi:hypothetical protein
LIGMNFWWYEFGICLAVFLAALALFQRPEPSLRRLGMVLMMGVSGLAVWFWTASVGAALFTVALWFVIPVVQAVWLTRRLSFSSRRRMEPGPISIEDYPALPTLSREFLDLGFRFDRDYWLKPSPFEQGYRIFVKEGDPTLGAVAILRQGPAVLTYVMWVTPAADGTVWVTWDYPLAYGLEMPPRIKVYRCMEAASSVREMEEQHREFLRINGVVPAPAQGPDPAGLYEDLFRSLVDHNIHNGLLMRHGPDDEVRYTWRGTFYVSWQVLVEVVRG